jgi:uncharacterized membrane protein
VHCKGLAGARLQDTAPASVCDNAPRRAVRGGAAMGKGRFEAFSDGVLAIIITIMVLELKVPHGETLAALAELWPVFLSYVISFIYVGIYWNNHHHLLHATTAVTGGMMWANLHLLFWLSLMPFATGWMGENHFGAVPSAVYGTVLLMSAVSWTLLQTLIVCAEGEGGVLKRALGTDRKGKLTLVLYVVGIASSFALTGLAQAMYVIAALIWLVPDRRIEKALVRERH